MFRIYQLLRLFYYPFFNWVFFVFPKINTRLKFERLNESCAHSQSFKLSSKTADICFEVSSEGELEQIRPVLMEELSSGALVELVFASDSVKKQCSALAEEFADNLRIFRYPLLTYLPGRWWSDPLKWISAKKLVLCRYDFFPELLKYGRKKDVEFILLSGSLKNFETKSGPAKKFYSFSYHSFDKIVAATALDQERFEEKLGIRKSKVESFDFRPLAIEKRQAKAYETLGHRFPDFESFFRLAQEYNPRRRIVFGSFWEYETEAFNNGFDFKNNFLCLVPHKLDDASIGSMKVKLKEKFPEQPIYEWNKDFLNNKSVAESFFKRPGVVIINLKGVLCELYTIFGASFVGGGHGVSVHSLLEPFMAGCMVYCGPKVHRSTEYDLIIQNYPDRLRIVDRLDNVVENFESDISTELSDITKFIKQAKNKRKAVMKWLQVGEEETNGSI
ncbi:MAG: hypothetical protein CME64_16575 [Halobacteriovoraceae bacterium]|nr:hypothetical protein [Halobacteriovoraceae bacterium]|tara:strand:+ start:146208 stop:147545 length:1338 start_codon:yes stop_codon:yes gene_type:complete